MAFRWKPQDLSYEQYQFLQDPNNAFKNRANTKQAQSMLGFEGTDVDGKIGPATRNAYNSQMPYYRDLYGKVDKAGALDLNDPNAFYEDMHAAETYGFTPQEAEESLNADIQQQKIADIQSQIEALKTRIAENEAKLKNWNGGDVTNKIAALEARKFFSQDPTSIWRWKAQMDENRRIAEKANGTANTAKANAMIEIANDLDSIIVDDTMTSQDKKAYLSKLSNMKTLGEKAGVPKSVIDNINAKIKEVKGNGGEQTSREQATTDFETLLNNPNLSVELLDKFEASNPNLSRADWGRLDNKRAELVKNAAKKSENEDKAKARETKILGMDPNSATSDEISFMEKRGYKRVTGDRLSDTKWVKVK